MKARLTYWDIIDSYHHSLYKSKIYWASASCVIIAALLLLISLDSWPYSSLFLIVGVILLLVSKAITLKKDIAMKQLSFPSGK